MSPTTVRWGILATGLIAETFSKDLLVDPQTRGVKEIKHNIVAVSSSTSKERAEKFIKTVGADSSAKAYGSYAEFVKDPNVDIVYVATPHSHHFQNVMLCLEAGKHVLCEKAFTVNAEQLKILVKKAQEKNLFLMEAVWTRYFPLSIYVRDAITSGKIGTVHRVSTDLSFAQDPEKAYPDGKHRMVNPELAGGALLDLGIYALTWVFQTVYHTQPEAERQAPKVMAALKQYSTGADEQTTMLLNFPHKQESGGDIHAVATTSIRVASDPDSKGTAGAPIRVQGTKGEIQVLHPAFRPTKTRIILSDGTVEEKEFPQPGPGKGSGWYNGFSGGNNGEGVGHGMFWEADEAATAVVEGRKEGRYESLAESIVIMETMDEVRRQGGMKYPEKIESTKYPVEL